jgi:uncharacterized protein YceK
MRRIRLCLPTAMLLAAVVCLSGCGLIRTRTVLIPPGEPVQLAEEVKAYVYVEVAGKRVKSANRVTLPEGWWCLPDPGQ